MADDRSKQVLRKLGDRPTGLPEYSTATLADGMQKIGLAGQVLEPAIRPLLPFTKMVGSAVTIKLEAAEEAASYSRLVGEAFAAGLRVFNPILVIEQPPDLIGATVVGSGGAYVMRHQFGFVGCLCDGLVRDTDDLKRMNFPVYSRGCHPEYIFAIMQGVAVNTPVQVGGVTINPGDFIVGDNDGVVAIPPAQADDILRGADEILAQEKQILEEIDAGTPYLEVLRRLQPEAFQGEE